MAAHKEIFNQEYRDELVDKLKTPGLRDAAHREQDQRLDELKDSIDQVLVDDKALGEDLQKMHAELTADYNKIKTRSLDTGAPQNFKGPVLNYLKRLADLNKLVEAAQVATAEQAISARTDISTRKQQELEAATLAHSNFETQKQALDASFSGLRADLAAADAELTSATEKARLSAEAVNKKRSEIAQVMADKQKIDDIKSDPKTQYDAYDSRSKTSEAKVRRLAAELKVLSDALEGADDDHSVASTERFSPAAHKRELNKVDEKIKELNSELAALEASFPAADKSALEKAVTDFNPEIERLKIAMAKAKEDASHETEQIKTDIERANLAIEEAVAIRDSFHTAVINAPNPIPVPPPISTKGTQLGANDRENHRKLQELNAAIGFAVTKRDRLIAEAPKQRKAVRDELHEKTTDLKAELADQIAKQSAAEDALKRRQSAIEKKKKDIADAKEEKNKITKQGLKRRDEAHKTQQSGKEKSRLESQVAQKEADLAAAKADHAKNQADLALAASVKAGKSAATEAKLDSDLAMLNRELDSLIDRADEDKEDLAEAAEERRAARAALTKARADKKNIVNTELAGAERKIADAKRDVELAENDIKRAKDIRDQKRQKFQATPEQTPQILKSREKKTVDIPPEKLLHLIGEKKLDAIITMIAEGGAFEAKQAFAKIFSNADLDAVHEIVEEYGYNAGDFIDDWKTNLHVELFANLGRIVEEAWDKQVTLKVKSIPVTSKKPTGGMFARLGSLVSSKISPRATEYMNPSDPAARLQVQREYRTEIEQSLLNVIDRDKNEFIKEMSRVLSQSLREASAKQNTPIKLGSKQGTDALAIADLRERINKGAAVTERAHGARAAEISRSEQTEQLDRLMTELTTEQNEAVLGFQHLLDTDPNLIKDLSKLNISNEAAAIIEKYNRRALTKAELVAQLPAILIAAHAGSGIEKALAFSKRPEVRHEVTKFRAESLRTLNTLVEDMNYGTLWIHEAAIFLKGQGIPESAVNSMNQAELGRRLLSELRTIRSNRVLATDFSLSRQLDDFIYRIDKNLRDEHFATTSGANDEDRATQMADYLQVLEGDKAYAKDAEARLKLRLAGNLNDMGEQKPNLRDIIGTKPKPKKKLFSRSK